MEKLVLEAVERFGLLKNGDSVTVALSGGADSMSLLYALLSLKERLGITLSAAHLNHCIRGEEADRDEAFVKAQCEKLGIECFCEKSDIPRIAAEQSISIELAARKVRYEFLERVAKGVIATAHNADDNLETVIFNLTRGTAIDGLCGIPPKRGRIVRPLLLCERAEIEKYCKDNEIPFVTDSTNLSDDYTRNKIRHNIIPKLYELNSGVKAAALRMTQTLREDAAALDKLCEQYLKLNTLEDGLNLKGFELLDAAVGKRVLKRFVEDIISNTALESVHIDSIYEIALKGGRASLPKNYTAVSKNSSFRLERLDEKTGFEVSLSYKDNTFFENGKKINNLLLNSLLDCDKIVGKLEIRTRIVGDKVRLVGRGCTKTLKSLYNECNIPLSHRQYLPVISDDNGVVWVYGIGVAQRCAVSHNTKKIIEIDVIKEENKNERRD